METDETGVFEIIDHPEDRSMVAPRYVALDPRLSARAKGLMFIMLAFPKGHAPSTERLLPYCKEGRDAVRAGLNELEAAGYITRERRQVEGGRWTTITALHPYGSPMTDFQASVNQASVPPMTDFQASVQPTPENQALSSNSYIGTTSKEVAAADHIYVQPLGDGQNLDGSQQPVEDDQTQAVTGRNPDIPWTEVHLLRTWFHVEKPEQVEAWRAAWRTGMTVASEGYDPQVHLVTYLTRCREEKREAKPGLWLRFLIEDRQKFLMDQRAHEDKLEQQAAADGGESWSLRSLKRTPRWEAGEQ